jgi:hypothetical protein
MLQLGLSAVELACADEIQAVTFPRYLLYCTIHLDYITFLAFSIISLLVVNNNQMTCSSAWEMAQYDVVFKWFGNLFQTLISSLGGPVEDATTQTVHIISRSICNSHSRYCDGESRQYRS